MSFKCSERAFACKNSSPYVFGQSVPGKPQIRPLFPQHTNFSGTCDSNNDRNHSFHFLSNWRRNGERIKTTVSNFSNTCYWVCSGSSRRRSRRRRQRLWFVQFAKFASTPRKKLLPCLKKLQNPQMAFPYQTSCCCCIPPHIYISAFLHVLSPTITSLHSHTIFNFLNFL